MFENPPVTPVIEPEFSPVIVHVLGILPPVSVLVPVPPFTAPVRVALIVKLSLPPAPLSVAALADATVKESPGDAAPALSVVKPPRLNVSVFAPSLYVPVAPLSVQVLATASPVSEPVPLIV